MTVSSIKRGIGQATCCFWFARGGWVGKRRGNSPPPGEKPELFGAYTRDGWGDQRDARRGNFKFALQTCGGINWVMDAKVLM